MKTMLRGIFTQDGFLDNLLEAEENRKTEIRAELANARAATYYHPSNGQYVNSISFN